jgi:large subunit ribosomal protein L25
MDGLSVSVDGRELRHALSGGSGSNQLLSLKIGTETHLALARVLQRHPVRHTVVHVDFQVVRRDEVISAEVPIILTGEARHVEMDQGILEQPLMLLTVNATPSLIPNNIEVDISGLSVGDSIRVSDLPLPSGVTTDVDPEEIVVIASGTRAATEAGEPSAEGAEEAASGGGDAAQANASSEES